MRTALERRNREAWFVACRSNKCSATGMPLRGAPSAGLRGGLVTIACSAAGPKP